VRFHKDGSVLVWDGPLMRYRAPTEKERSEILAWLDDLTTLAKSVQPKP